MDFVDDGDPDQSAEIVERVMRLFPGCSDAELVGRVAAVRGPRAPPAPAAGVLRRRDRIRAYQRQLEALLLDRDRASIPQRTPAWYEARKTMVTASELQDLFGNEAARRQLLAKKMADAAANNALSEVPAIMWGVKYEPVACELYRRRTGCEVHEFGLMRHGDLDGFGASPDGINDQGILLEIKCPYSRQITGQIPKAYATQMQSQMHVAGLRECDYLECKFHEYGGYDEYRADAHPLDARLTAAGMEKGAVRGDRVFVEDGTDAFSGRRWSDPIEGDEDDGTAQTTTKTYWRIEVFGLQRVHADPAFMDAVRPAVEAFMVELRHLRALRAAGLMEAPDISEDKPLGAVKAERQPSSYGGPGAKLPPFAFIGIQSTVADGSADGLMPPQASNFHPSSRGGGSGRRGGFSGSNSARDRSGGGSKLPPFAFIM